MTILSSLLGRCRADPEFIENCESCIKLNVEAFLMVSFVSCFIFFARGSCVKFIEEIQKGVEKCILCYLIVVRADDD